jgi:hypothetical protein
MSIFKITRETRIIFISVICICLIAFSIAFFYYRGINRSEDPRVIEPRFMLVRYNKLMAEKKFSSAFPVMDSVEHIFLTVPGYDQSFELGIVYNNRASVYISMALYSGCDSTEKQHLLKLAEKNTIDCINLYENWLNRNEKLTKTEILRQVQPFFPENDKAFKDRNYRQILNKRVKDIVLAQKETTRRLSVAYTNLGIIQRHQYLQNKAIESYIKAITLWKDNPTASSNLNVLFGKPPKDRSVIKKLFPPKK